MIPAAGSVERCGLRRRSPFEGDDGRPLTPRALPLRDDLSPAELRARARRGRDGRARARLLAIADALAGMSRAAAAAHAGMAAQTLRDGVHRSNGSGAAGLRDRPRSGRPCRLDEGRRAALKGLILKRPDRKRDGLSAWRRRDPCDPTAVRFEVRPSATGMRRSIRGLNPSRQKARPVPPRAASRAERERFKKTRPSASLRSRPPPRGPSGPSRGPGMRPASAGRGAPRTPGTGGACGRARCATSASARPTRSAPCARSGTPAAPRSRPKPRPRPWPCSSPGWRPRCRPGRTPRSCRTAPAGTRRPRPGRRCRRT
jgi:transposase